MFVNKQQKTRGQALVEFALVMPILALIILGIFDFARVMFTFAQGTYQLRSALRQASAVGFSGGDPYLDCTTMRELAEEIWFAEPADPGDIVIKYIKADSYPSSIPCAATGDVIADQLVNGDMLYISIDIEVVFVAFPAQSLNLTFAGQRSIVKSIPIGALENDDDHDGLDDTWEFSYFGPHAASIGYNYWDAASGTSTMLATDDPDGDGINNGAEEARGSDPTVKDGIQWQTTLLVPSAWQTGPMKGLPQAGNFQADVPSCAGASNPVNFSWDTTSWVDTPSGRIWSSRATFYYRDNYTAFYTTPDLTLGNSANGITTIASETARSYYMIPSTTVNIDDDGDGTADRFGVSIRGVVTQFAVASCITPPQPVAFNVSCNPVANPNPDTINFQWDDWSANPPSSAEIYRDLGGGSTELLRVITDFQSALPARTWFEGDDFDNPPGPQDYYMITIVNGVESIPSATQTISPC